MKILYNSLEKKLGINFKDKDLLVKSLTHKSFDNQQNNEKIEFLGDRVLGLVIAKKLLEIYPNEKEGVLDKKFASLVNRRTCLQIANEIELEKYILVFRPKNRKTIIENKVIADSCEALIGAIYKCFNSILEVNLWLDDIWEIDSEIFLKAPYKFKSKTVLQEWCQSKGFELPVYKIIQVSDKNGDP